MRRRAPSRSESLTTGQPHERAGARASALGACMLLGLIFSACDSPIAPPDVAPDPTGPCQTANSLCQERIAIGDGHLLPVYRTHALDMEHEEVTRGLIVIHGTNRNADTYFSSGVQAAADGGQRSTTVVISPQFQTEDDGPAVDEPFWSSSGWKRGHLSSTNGPSPRVSSYAALDSLVAQLLDSSRFPALQEVVVTGHSAGGQVVHRYAATSTLQERHPGTRFRYVVANPSTYLYLRPERAGGGGEFSTPTDQGCEDFDDWHYGLEGRNTYASAVPADTIRVQLSRRDVRILIGDADSLSAALDVTCGANLQGPYRYARGQNLVRFMDTFFPGHGHREMVVPGIGHSNRSMWLSETGLQSLFGM